MNYFSQLPNAKLVSTVTQKEDEQAWKDFRKKGIGGSEVGAICGVSKWSSAMQVFLDKTGQFDGMDSFENSLSDEAKERMMFGHILEPVVADEFVRRYNLDNPTNQIKAVSLNASMCHKDETWMRSNIDYLIVDDSTDKALGVLECKTTGEYAKNDWESGNVPLYYYYQLQWYLHVTGLERGWLACLVGGNKFYWYEVWRNDELLEKDIIPKCKEFWFENVCKLIDPVLQAADTEYVKDKHTYEELNNDTLFIEDDISDELASTVIECKAKIKELTSIKDAAENRLKDMIGNYELARTNSHVIKWPNRQQVRVDTDKLKEEFPEVYLACQKTISFRQLYLKGAK